MESVNKYFKEEDDVFFIKGEEKGKVEGKIEKSQNVVENLILELSLPDDVIARIADVSIDFVKSVRAGLKK